jgi:ABC-type glycerol-3-phosphate transport system substrate-binding protein
VLPDDPFGPVSGKAYAQHRVAFAVSANWLGHYGIEPGYPKQKKEWDFTASLPSVGWWGGGLFAVPPQSTHQAEAQQLALYCSTSPTFQHQTGTVPAYTGVWKTAGAFIPDPFWADPSEVVRQLRLSAQHTGTGWTISPNMPYVDTQAGAAVKSMVNGTPVHAALQKLQSQVVENLKLTGITVK